MWLFLLHYKLNLLLTQLSTYFLNCSTSIFNIFWLSMFFGVFFSVYKNKIWTEFILFRKSSAIHMFPLIGHIRRWEIKTTVLTFTLIFQISIHTENPVIMLACTQVEVRVAPTCALKLPKTRLAHCAMISYVILSCIPTIMAVLRNWGIWMCRMKVRMTCCNALHSPDMPSFPSLQPQISYFHLYCPPNMAWNLQDLFLNL